MNWFKCFQMIHKHWWKPWHIRIFRNFQYYNLAPYHSFLWKHLINMIHYSYKQIYGNISWIFIDQLTHAQSAWIYFKKEMPWPFVTTKQWGTCDWFAIVYWFYCNHAMMGNVIFRSFLFKWVCNAIKQLHIKM